MRVYLPTTLNALAALRSAGEVGPAPLVAHAVIPALREWYAGSDEEELEYAALGAAARASLAQLAQDPGAPARRVVLAADVPDSAVVAAPGQDRSAVRLAAPVAWRLLASVHADDADAEGAVRAAAGALAAAEAGDDDAAFVVDGAEDHELLWYGVQEVAGLVGD